MRPTVIDLFCGAGGLSAGFEQAGFRILAGNDINTFAGKTFSSVHPGAHFFPHAVEELAGKDLLSATGLSRGELDCLVGGPPCQAYSVYNHKRGLDDRRSILFREYLRLVEEIQPKWLVMENVTGIQSVANGEPVRAIISGLRDIGYHVEHQVLKAEDFGIPQERRRLLFIGNRLGAPIPWPKHTHGTGLQPYVNVWNAIGDLPKLANGESPTRAQKYRSAPTNSYQLMLRGNRVYVDNHTAPKLAQINVERMSHIPSGGSWRDIPFDLLPAGMKLARRCDHTKRYGRLTKDGLSSTILTKCDIHWGAFIHPEQDRALTVREAARLQSFPDSFVFSGPKTEQYIQVGNAVPPLLGKCVAQAIMGSINQNICDNRVTSASEPYPDLLSFAV